MWSATPLPAKGDKPENGPFELNESTMAALGEAFWNMVKHYALTRSETALLLGINDNRRRLAELQSRSAIPEDPDKVQRVGHLIGIHKNLRILFPHNRDVVYSWMKTPSNILGGISPIEYIRQDPVNSLPRLFKLRRTLDQIRCGA